MAGTLKLDGYDIWTHLRLAPGEGFDPADNDFLQPQFGDAGAGEGDALISIGERNRELAFPVILNPAKAGYADSKDGLHDLVRDLQRRIKTARTLEWRDDGATDSSYLDVQAARLEIDYQFRRAQQKWLNAIVRVWTHPYAHTATMRSLGTVAATSRPVTAMLVASGIDGDAPTDLDITVSFLPRVASYAATGGLFAGVVVSESDIWQPPASLSFVSSNVAGTLAAATLQGASGAAASQMQTVNVAPFIPGAQIVLLASGVDFTPASGGLRLIALARNRAATSVYLWGANYDTGAFSIAASGAIVGPALLGPTQTLAAGEQWRLVDLGVIRYGGERRVTIGGGYSAFLGGPTALVDFGGLLKLPENTTAAVYDRAMATGVASPAVASYFFGGTRPAFMTRTRGATNAAGPVTDMLAFVRGGQPQFSLAASHTVQAFAIPDNGAQNPAAVTAEVRVREKFTYHR